MSIQSVTSTRNVAMSKRGKYEIKMLANEDLQQATFFSFGLTHIKYQIRTETLITICKAEGSHPYDEYQEKKTLTDKTTFLNK